MTKAQLVLVDKNDLLEAMEEMIRKYHKGKHLNSEAAEEDFCDIDEAVRITKRKKSTIYKLRSENKIPHYKNGRKLYFKRSELLAWIEKGNPKTEPLNNLDEYLLNNRI